MSALPALDDSPQANSPRAKAEPWSRLIRISRAHTYLGMCRRVFEATVRPHVRVVPIGKQGKAVDRHELDAFADAYVARHAIDKAPRPGNPEPASERRHETAGATERKDAKMVEIDETGQFETAVELHAISPEGMELDALKSAAAIAWGWLWHVTTSDDRVMTARDLLGQFLSRDLKRYGIQTAKDEGAQVNVHEIEAAMIRGGFGDS